MVKAVSSINRPELFATHLQKFSGAAGYLRLLSSIDVVGFFRNSFSFKRHHRKSHRNYIGAVRWPDVATLLAL